MTFDEEFNPQLIDRKSNAVAEVILM